MDIVISLSIRFTRDDRGAPIWNREHRFFHRFGNGRPGELYHVRGNELPELRLIFEAKELTGVSRLGCRRRKLSNVFWTPWTARLVGSSFIEVFLGIHI